MIEYKEIEQLHLIDKSRLLINCIQILSKIDNKATIRILEREIEILKKKEQEAIKYRQENKDEIW